jgi:hypothetical protein
MMVGFSPANRGLPAIAAGKSTNGTPHNCSVVSEMQSQLEIVSILNPPN